MVSPRIIVAGGGLAGLTASLSLLERGASVLILEKNKSFGGNSVAATSGVSATPTPAQAAAGIYDSPAIFFDDSKKSAGSLARDPLLKTLTFGSASALDWVEDSFGLKFDRVSRLGGSTNPGTHRGAGAPGWTMTKALIDRANQQATEHPDRLQIVLNATVKSILQNGPAVYGVRYEVDGQAHEAYGPLILATGGYAADFSESDSLLKEFRPEWYALSTTNGPGSAGDGHKMVRSIGGSLINMNQVQVHPTGLVDPKDPDAKKKFLGAEALRGAGGLLLDAQGNRFVDELEKRNTVTQAMWDRNQAPYWLVFNGQAGKELDFYIKFYSSKGLVHSYESIDSLAQAINVNPTTLNTTFEQYEQVGKGAKPDPFGKQYHSNYEFSQGPWYAAQVTPVLHYTMGGVEVDAKARVLQPAEPENKPIPGLFAAGEVGGGIHGENRLGGSGLLTCLVYGRQAAESAAAYLLEALTQGRTFGPASTTKPHEDL